MNLPCVNLPLIHELADGELDLPTTRRINEHMLECASCSDEYLFVSELRDAAHELPRTVPADHVWDSIAAAIGTGAYARSDDGDDGLDEPAAANMSLVVPQRRFWTIGRAVAASIPLVAAGAITASLVHDVMTRRDPTPPARASIATVSPGAPAQESGPASEPQFVPARRRESATIVPISLAPKQPSTREPVLRPAEQTATAATSTGPRGLPAEFLMQYAGHDLLNQPSERSSEVDRELLIEAEAAIARCTVALQDNPDDPRVRTALTRAYQQKVAALRSLAASSTGYASRGRRGVTVEPASVELPATGTGP